MGRNNGIEFQQYLEFIAAVKAGRKVLHMAPDYVVMSRELYSELSKPDAQWLFSSVHATEVVERIQRDLAYLSEYVMNHWPDDSMQGPYWYVDKLTGMNKDIDILKVQFKRRLKEWAKRH